MNIVYIIGNGFDLNLGLKTRYQDFYEYYKKQHSNDELIAEKKKEMEEFGSDTWGNLEIALGKFTAKFDSTDDFEKVYFDISDKLADYIRLEEDKLVLSDKKKSKLCKDIISPESHLRLTDKKSVIDYGIQWQNGNLNINIINFNYSKTMERLLDFQIDGLGLGRKHPIGNVYLQQIVHIHGVANENTTILLGVNDPSQIENESFRVNIDHLDLMVKPRCNDGLGDEIDATCVRFLNEANLICIFGSSLGNTDKIWWEILGGQLKRGNCRVIYFVHENNNISGNHRQLFPRKIRECKDYILSKTNLTPQEKEGIENKIWVGHSTGMFKLE